jgi:hypothetical protein
MLSSYELSFLIDTVLAAVTALSSLIQSWKNKPLNWVGSDPCGSDWDGIRCSNTRITELLDLYFFVPFKFIAPIQELPN